MPLHWNPFDYLKDFLLSCLKGLVGNFETLIAHPARAEMNAPLDYLYGNALGSAGRLALSVAVATSVIAILHRKTARRAIDAFGAVIALVVLTPIWFAVADGLVAFGNVLSDAAQFYHPPPSQPTGVSFLTVPPTGNIVTAIIGGGFISFWGAVLLVIFYMYQVLIIIVKFGLLFGISLYGINHRLLYWLLSTGLLTMTLGRPAAILMIEVGKVMTDYGLLGKSVFGTCVYLIASLIVAISIQVAIYIGLRKKVFNSEVFGRVASRVTGKVKSVVKRTPQQSSNMARQAHQGSMPMTVRMHKPPLKKRLVKTGVEHGVRTGAQQMGLKVAAAAGPEAVVVVAAAAMARKVARQARARRNNRASSRTNPSPNAPGAQPPPNNPSGSGQGQRRRRGGQQHPPVHNITTMPPSAPRQQPPPAPPPSAPH